jgi:SAM-dependent methyltransferase
VNKFHLEFCSSPGWAQYVRDELLPWALTGRDLGDDILELGPGPGLTTDVLRAMANRVTAVEIDPTLAGPLAERLQGTNVDVINRDATDTGLPDARFSAATCFTMLHHVPSSALQDQLFAEVGRVLRPDGVFVGTDSVESELLRAGHLDDTFVPVDPDTLPARLEAAGLRDVTVERDGDRVRFTARRPLGGS